MANVVRPFGRAYTRVFGNNEFKQGGLCHLCKKCIKFGEAIISAGEGKRKYYHVACARKLMIIARLNRHNSARGK